MGFDEQRSHPRLPSLHSQLRRIKLAVPVLLGHRSASYPAKVLAAAGACNAPRNIPIEITCNRNRPLSMITLLGCGHLVAEPRLGVRTSVFERSNPHGFARTETRSPGCSAFTNKSVADSAARTVCHELLSVRDIISRRSGLGFARSHVVGHPSPQQSNHGFRGSVGHVIVSSIHQLRIVLVAPAHIVRASACALGRCRREVWRLPNYRR